VRVHNACAARGSQRTDCHVASGEFPSIMDSPRGTGPLDLYDENAT
jgi:hypothetical protein